jgi:HK97 family phage major capsid protein
VPDTKPTPGGETRADEVATLLADDLRGKTPEGLDLLVRVVDGHLESLHQDERGAIRELDAAERTTFDGLMALRQRAMDRLEEHRKVTEVLQRRPAQVMRALSAIGADEDPTTAIRRMRPPELRDAALRRLENKHDTAHLSTAAVDQVERSIRRDTSMAARILVTEDPHYRTAWMKLMTRTHPNLNPEEQRAVGAWEEYRAMSENTTTAGGFGVPAFVDPSIVLTAQESGNPFLQLARQVDTPTNVWKGVSSAGVSWTFQTEGATVTDGSPTLAQPSVTVHQARGFIPFSIEVGMDYAGFADEMSRLLAAGFDEIQVDKYTRGSGTGEPQGILTALSANTNVRVSVATSGTNFNAGDPYGLWKSLPQKYRRKASWLMSVGVNNAIRQLGTANVYHASTVTLPEEWADTLFTKAVYESPYMPDVTTSTSATTGLAIVGDFSNYVIARRGGMEVEYVPQLFQQVVAGTGPAVPTGQRGWFAHARVGGASINDLGFRILVNT